MQSTSFIADIHIHSKYSRATAANLDLENLYIWSQQKGIDVVGTGDFTHPDWFREITDKLEPAEPGLYRLKSEIARHCDQNIPLSCRSRVRFMLSCEISNIYKKNGRTRKNHNLVFFPGLSDVRRFNARLNKIGNINADGRPILGLDARDLLEIVLETSEDGFLIPAHIWTPWFSMLGSKSGFDSIEACFGDLSNYIFAVETGLSSDPAMNRRVAGLDQVTLISNSDAHSPSKLGREANLFNTELSYFAMRAAMETGDRNQFLGTFEFYPEEGKYHADGHRQCDVSLMPAQTRANQGLCPVCGKPLTLGVLHRVESLATRPDGGDLMDQAIPFYRLIPLEHILSDILKVGPQSKKVKQTYFELLAKLDNELSILHALPIEQLDDCGVPLIGEAILRMRNHQVNFSPGFDGRFGSFQLFTDQERYRLLGQRRLFAAFDKQAAGAEATHCASIPQEAGALVDTTVASSAPRPPEPNILLNDEQQAAVYYTGDHLMVIAGPGTGKTRTLTHRIAHLIGCGADPERMLAVTFTNKAATEMMTRLRSLLGQGHPLPFVGTFHALGFRVMRQLMDNPPRSIIDTETRIQLVRDVISLSGHASATESLPIQRVLDWIAAAKQRLIDQRKTQHPVDPSDREDFFNTCYEIYQQLLQANHAVDFEDLIVRAIHLLERDAPNRESDICRYSHLFIDEYQDINARQYRLIRRLAGKTAKICIIGDPDQSIYGFRGADAAGFEWFKNDHASLNTIFLNRNYRSTQTILDVSMQVIRNNPQPKEIGDRRQVYSTIGGPPSIHILASASAKAEAVAIGKQIETMVGGTGFLSLDTGVVDGHDSPTTFGFGDFAVLFRTRNQRDILAHMLGRAGIPCQQADRQTVLEHPGIQAVLCLFKMLKGLAVVADLSVASDLTRPPITAGILERLKMWAYRNRMDLEQALQQARRIPIPQMRRRSQQRLYEWIGELMNMRRESEAMSVNETIDWIISRGEWTEKYKDDQAFATGCQCLRHAATAHASDAVGFVARIGLSGHTDIYDHHVEQVALMTMHAAKGLEFPVVFIAGCEAGWIPFQSERRPADIEEERRLFYVAMTRAKRHLFLTFAARRRINGQSCARRVSPFVGEMESHYKEEIRCDGHKGQHLGQRQLPLF